VRDLNATQQMERILELLERGTTGSTTPTRSAASSFPAASLTHTRSRATCPSCFSTRGSIPLPAPTRCSRPWPMAS